MVPFSSPVQVGAAEAPLPSGEVYAQRMRALRSANNIRTARATLKNDLASGRVRIENLLDRPPAFAATAKVSDLLLAVPGVGPVRTTRALANCQIPHAKTLGGLSGRQRLALIAVLSIQA